MTLFVSVSHRVRYGYCVQARGLESHPQIPRLRIGFKERMGKRLGVKAATPRETQTHGLPDVDRALLCTSITGLSVEDALEGIAKGNCSGADVLELRLDFYKDFSSTDQLKTLMDACKVPYIVTYRPSWEGYAPRVISTFLVDGQDQHTIT